MNYIEYDKDLHGTLVYPEGFKEMLKGHSIEEQLDFFRMGNGLYRKEPVLERRKVEHNYSNRIENEENVEAVITNDGLIAGVMVRDCNNRLVACLPEWGYLIRDDSEPDGSGYIEYQLFNYIICVPENFDEMESK